MALALTITDNADGTGGVATIAGADAATATVYYQTQGGSWTSAGSRTGDGNITLSLDVGYYFFYATGTVSGSPAITAVQGLTALTSGTEAVHYQYLAAIASNIQAIAAQLDGWTSTNISTQWALDDSAKQFPHIFVTPSGNESQTGGVNDRDDWSRPVLVSLVVRNHQNYQTDLNKYLLWRERIIKRFHNTTVIRNAVAVNYRTIVEPRPVVEFIQDKVTYMVLAFLVRCIGREARA